MKRKLLILALAVGLIGGLLAVQHQRLAFEAADAGHDLLAALALIFFQPVIAVDEDAIMFQHVGLALAAGAAATAIGRIDPGGLNGF